MIINMVDNAYEIESINLELRAVNRSIFPLYSLGLVILHPHNGFQAKNLKPHQLHLIDEALPLLPTFNWCQIPNIFVL